MENRIQKDLVAAMKAKDTVKLATLRAIKTAITVAKTAPNAPETLTDADIINIIQKLVKQRKDSAEQYNDAGRPELAENELAEMKVMEKYLPKQMTESQIRLKIMELHDMGYSNMGVIMKYFKECYSGKYDGKVVSTTAKEILEKK